MSTFVTILTNFSGDSNYTMRTRLDGRDFNLRFLWNEREERWYMDILSDADVPLAMGIKIVTNRPLIRYYKWDSRLPQGELWAIDLSSIAGEPPGFNELGKGQRVELSYQQAGF